MLLSKLALWLLCFATLPLSPEETHASQVPELHGKTLTELPVNLPQDLIGHRTVLIVGFSQKSSDAVAQWARRLAADYRESQTFLYYEMPMLAEVPRVLRGLVLRKIQQDVPPRAQSRFIPINDHEDQWKAVAGFDKAAPDAAYLLLVDQAGKIVSHRSAGLPTDGSYADLKRSLEALAK